MATREFLLKMALNGETIHSGHFMASNVHECKVDDDEDVDVVSDSGVEPPDPDVTPDTKDDKPVTFYKFGPKTTRSIAIDVSLTKLNKCIQIAYEKGKLTTPKWKSFKGMKIQWKDRIRLNNVIWRAWHMQFVQNNKPKYCFFSVPEEDWHSRSEAPILEGMYWKRRLDTVCAQYTRWRHYYYKQGKQRSSSMSRGDNRRSSESDTQANLFDDELLFPTSFTPLTFDNDDDFTSWFTDTLFSSLNQPYMFPNPKQFAQTGNADLVQPGLIQLQPSLEEIMASLESSSNFLSGDNDPLFASNELMDQSGLQETTSSMPMRPASVAGSSSSSHYTSKDYADARLLVNYAKSHHSTTTPATPLSGSDSRPSCSSKSHPPRRYQRHDSSFDTPLGYPQAGSPLCEPYVPQVVASIDTIRSQQVQYTVAKMWQEESPQEMQNHSNHRHRRISSREVEDKFSMFKKRCDINSQKTSVCPPAHKMERTTKNAQTVEALLISKTPAIAATKPRRATKKKVMVNLEDVNPKVAVQQVEKCSKQRPVVATSTSNAEKFNSVLPLVTPQYTPQPPPPLNASAMTISCNLNQAMEIQPIYTGNSGIGFLPSPSSSSNILRPIPISLGRADQSAFSPLSPNSGYGNPLSVGSPMQRSPTTSSNELWRNVSCGTPTPTTLVHVQPTSTAPFLTGTPTNAQQNIPPVLILQSLGNMQFPLMALPYSNNSALPSTAPKQEPADKITVSDFNPVVYAPQTPAVSLPSPVKEESMFAAPVSKNAKVVKSTKRAADSTVDPMERKRMQHLHAEQSRRCALKNGFELLEELLPELHSTSTKATNALVLLKSAVRIRELKTTTVDSVQEIDKLKKDIQELNDKIAIYQTKLPVPTATSKSGLLQKRYSEYVKQRSQNDSKFWLLHKIMEPLFESMKVDVQGGTLEQLFGSSQEWAAKNCTHINLRPVASQLLVSLATDSPILSTPSAFSGYLLNEASKL